MQIVDAELATVDQAHAYQVRGRACRPSGRNKAHGVPCRDARTESAHRRAAGIPVRLSTDPRVRCTPDPASFEEQRAFRVGILRPQVNVHHATGELSVDVEDLTPGLQSASRESLGGSLFDLEPVRRRENASITPQPHEAVGRSRDYDLGEAMRAAIAQLPPQGAGIPDWLSTYTVVSIGAEIGGIGGFNHLTVRVSG